MDHVALAAFQARARFNLDGDESAKRAAPPVDLAKRVRMVVLSSDEKLLRALARRRREA